MEFTLTIWFVIFLGGMASGFIDSIAGGGGLISVPMLLVVGVPPHLAIGTNKIQSIFGSGTAFFRYSLKGLIPWKKVWSGMVMSFVAAMLGAWAVRQIDAGILARILPFILLILWLYVVVKKTIGYQQGVARMDSRLFYPTAGSIFGFYDGFFGPGTGSFWTVSQVYFLGYDLKQATAVTKPSNFASNVGALIFFMLKGQILIPIGLVMAAGQIIGAWIGAHLVIRNPPRFIRPFFLIAVAATILKLFWDQYGYLFQQL